MKLGTLLANIADTKGNEREQLKAEFLEKIKGHKEEKLLMECYASACAGCKYIRFDRKCLPPVELKEEGFILKSSYSGSKYCFC